MFFNFLKSTLRSLRMDKLTSMINLFGLSVGLTCSILIYLYVKNELTFDRFHKKEAQIYRVYTANEEPSIDDQSLNTSTSALLGPEMKNSLPEIINYARLTEAAGKVLHDGKSFDEEIALYDSTFFNIFSFKVLQGSLRHALNKPSDLVISEACATKYFGANDPIGEQLKIKIANDISLYTVKAVIEDPPSNSSIYYSMIAPYTNAFLFIPEDMGLTWHASFGETYVLLQSGIDPAVITGKMVPAIKSALADKYKEGEYFIHLQPIKELHFSRGRIQDFLRTSDIKYVYILSGVALLILLLASINFTTLSVGRSFVRAKEVGVRKVIGSTRGYIIAQFLGESVLMTFLGFLIALVLASIALPWFNQLSGVDLSFEVGGMDVLYFILFGLLIGMLSGSYPALFISRFQPQNILKGNFGSRLKKHRLRKGLVAAQYVIAITFISITVLMFYQMRYLMQKDLGFDREQLLNVRFESDISKGLKYSAESAIEKSQKISVELKKISGVQSVGFSTNKFDGNTWIRIGSVEKGQEDQMKIFSASFVDPGFIPTLGIELSQGRNFNELNASDYKNAVIVNNALVQEMGWTNPLGEKLPGRYGSHEIIGVTRDFIYESMRSEIRPLYLTMNPDFMFDAINSLKMNNIMETNLYLRLRAGSFNSAISEIGRVSKDIFPTEPFEFEFVDESVQAQFERERNMNKIITTATMLAIIVSSLGLFGLTYLTINSRIKEIGIRKVMGANTGSLMFHLLKDYFQILVIAVVIAIPAAYFLIQKWLEDFEFRITVQPYHFLIAIAIILVMSFLTISYLVMKTSLEKPANALRYE